MKPLIAFNLLFVDGGNLTGPGYYAVQLVEAFAKLASVVNGDYRVICYIQPAAWRHFNKTPRAWFRECRNLDGRISRVLYEHIVFPFRVRRDGVDLLFSPAFVSPLWGARQMVVGICDMYYRVIPTIIDRFQQRFWRVMIPCSVRVCSYVITISECSRRDIEHYLPKARGRVTVTPLASRIDDTTEPRLHIGRAKPYVLMVANLTPNKNCETVVAAITEIRARGRDIEFVHVGNDNDGRLRAAVQAVDGDAYVHPVGKVSDAVLRGYYRESLCVVTPSLYEGFGMPAVEAQAMGSVLVSSDRGALPEAAGDGALYFDPENVDQLVKAIERVADEPALRGQLRAAGRISAARFSWNLTAEKTLSAFQHVLDA